MPKIPRFYASTDAPGDRSNAGLRPPDLSGPIESAAQLAATGANIASYFSEAAHKVDVIKYRNQAEQRLDDLTAGFHLRSGVRGEGDLPQYEQETESIKRDILMGIKDGRTVRAVTEAFDSMAVDYRRKAYTNLRAKFVSDSQGEMVKELAMKRTAAANAGDIPERGKRIAEGRESIRLFAAAGIINGEEAAKQEKQFLADVAVDDVRTEILKDDFANARDKLKNKDIPEDKRLNLLNAIQKGEEAAIRKIEIDEHREEVRAAKAVTQQREADELDLSIKIMNGELSAKSLSAMAASRRISDGTYRTLMGHLESKQKEAKIDDLEFVSQVATMSEAGAEPLEVARILTQGVREGKVKRETALAFVQKAASEEFQAGLASITDTLKPSQADTWSLHIAKRLDSAKRQYIVDVRAGMSPWEASVKAIDSVLAGTRNEDIRGLSKPDYFQGEWNVEAKDFLSNLSVARQAIMDDGTMTRLQKRFALENVDKATKAYAWNKEVTAGRDKLSAKELEGRKAKK